MAARGTERYITAGTRPTSPSATRSRVAARSVSITRPRMTGTLVSARPTAASRTEVRRVLRATTVAVDALDRPTVAAAFALFDAAYDGADRARFERDLAEKQFVILLRDARTRALKGFSTVLVRDADVGGPATVVFSGDTVIDRAYWGQKALQSAFATLLVRLRLQTPRRRLYWFLLSKGYRTYLLLANAFPRAVPRCDRPDDPALGRALDQLAAERYGAQYDPTTRIVRYADAHERVREDLAPIAERQLASRHVRFFVERNPGHAAGDELACLARVRGRDLARVALRVAAARARRSLGIGGAAR